MDTGTDKSVILAEYADGPRQLEHTLAGLDESKLDSRGPKGGWSVRQIVHHIVDGDDIWKWCIKAALGNDGGEFSFAWYWALTQDVWADRWEYSARSIEVSLSLFRANREHVVELLDHVPDAWRRSVRLPTRDGRIETVTVADAVKIQAEHVTHHIEQIVALGER